MRKQILIIVIPGIIIGIIVAAVAAAISGTKPTPAAKFLEPVKLNKGSAADKQIQSAQAVIQKQPTEPRGYNMLAAAFIQKSRESGDFSLNARADESLVESFKLAPDNFDAIKLKATLMLNYHRFSEALEIARGGLAINPHDHEILGAMVDAYVELGDYENAVETAQKMVDLRPDTAAYSRISYLRFLHGDQKGAVEMMKMAAESASPQGVESAAWCRVHLGDELMSSGKAGEAEHQYDYALYLFPDYYTALAAKARARYADGDTNNAIAFYKRSIERVPLPDNIAALGDIYAKLGRADDAKQQYEQVEFIEKMGATGGTYSRQLALFWDDHDIRLDDALAIAEKERAERKDIYASDILAWSLYKTGRFDEAKTSIDEALRLDTRDPKLLYHAGMIAIALGDNQKGAGYLKQALAINPFFDVMQAEIAKDKLASLKGQ